jgi:hypothetical protein
VSGEVLRRVAYQLCQRDEGDGRNDEKDDVIGVRKL